MEASYIAAYRDGRLHEAIRRASLWMRKCTLCPRLCKVDRMSDEKGYCGTGRRAVVASFARTAARSAPWWAGTGPHHLLFPLQPVLRVLSEL